MARRAALTERSIAEAALALIDAEGIDGLSMRKLADALGSAPMSVYTYFPDRNAVLDAAAQVLYGLVEAPTDESLPPYETVRRIMHAVRAVISAHPKAASLITRYPPRTADALAFVEAGFRSFRRAGISAQDTARAYRALVAYSIGTAEIEVNGYFQAYPVATPAGASLDEPTAGRHLPNVLEIAPALAGQDDAQEFDYGLDLILDGFAHQRDHGSA
jgi:AcrR family transcriptional regulator